MAGLRFPSERELRIRSRPRSGSNPGHDRSAEVMASSKKPVTASKSKSSVASSSKSGIAKSGIAKSGSSKAATSKPASSKVVGSKTVSSKTVSSKTASSKTSATAKAKTEVKSKLETNTPAKVAPAVKAKAAALSKPATAAKAVAKARSPAPVLVKTPAKSAVAAPAKAVTTAAKAPAKPVAQSPIKAAAKAATKDASKSKAIAPEAAASAKAEAPTVVSKPVAKIIAASTERSAAPGVSQKTETSEVQKDGGKVLPKPAAQAAAPIQPTRSQASAGSVPGPAAAPAAPQNVAMKDDAVKSSQAKDVQSAIAAPAIGVPAKPVEKPAVKSGAHRTGFKTHEFIVYPAHGVGQIVAIEEQEVAGFKLELFVISFAKDKMTLKVPMPKVIAGAIRKLADADTVQRALDTLTGRARIKRTMWSRRAQEYEAKINSGDLHCIAEVVRDLYRSDAQPEQSYSERQLYEAALDRMAREIAAVQKLTDSESLKLIDAQLQKGPRRGAKVEVEPDADADGEPDGDVEEAA